MKVSIFFCLLTMGNALFISSISGCASAPKEQVTCNPATAPSSYKIYLYMSKDHNPPAQILEALEGNTSYALMQRDQDVKIVADLNTVGTDGVLLSIDEIGSLRGGFSKRIDIHYELINNGNKEVLLKGKDAVRSKLGYSKITVKMGKNIARKVTDLFHCLKSGGTAEPERTTENTSSTRARANVQ